MAAKEFTKPCSKCGAWRPHSDFSPRKEGKRLMSRCKSCRAQDRKSDRANDPEKHRQSVQRSRAKHHKEYLYYRARKNHLSVNYGLSLQEYEALGEKQNWACAICKNPEESVDPRRGGSRKLAIDHCHTSGKVRGLLCGRCNSAIGLTKENIKTLEAAIEYLKSYS